MTISIKGAVGALGCLAAGALISVSPAQAQRSQSIANPASTFCEEQGGRSIMRNGTGYCRLSNGRTVEEWAYFRQQNGDRRGNDGGIGMSNPAANHCSAIGGRNVTRRDLNGSDAAYCRLKTGRTVDAWQLFRQSDRGNRESLAATRYCTSQGGRLVNNNDGTHGCRTRKGDVFGAQQFYDIHHGKRR